MFEDLNAQLGKVEGSVRSAFTDTKAAIANQKTLIQTIDADLLSAFDRVEGIAKKVESTIHGRLEDVRSAVQRLVT